MNTIYMYVVHINTYPICNKNYQLNSSEPLNSSPGTMSPKPLNISP